ncbi:hypothetical protein SteCoe_19588 [Stentor coeruleus]|uniref:EF-hand domain-containing protein n=1 Tax=Stentor coeruleus TaxID=5963 RepID=A0A1R2BTT3_9CILI|nr:hypothetical protein SteCoe_19588 [Stentor coeruleus]
MESISTEDLEKFSKNFNSISDLFNEKHKEKLLASFQENLKKNFSTIQPTDNINLIRAKLSMWRFNWQVLEKYLEASSINIGTICSGIISSIFSISEFAIKNWEKETNKKENSDTEINVKQEEISVILLASESLEQKVRTLTQEKEALTQELHKTQDELSATLDLLQRENKTFLHKIIALSKQTADISVPQSPSKVFRKNITPKIPNNTILMNNRINQGRELSIKQLKETIEEIYVTKIKFDEKCKENMLPVETMDQFVVTYFNQKFGLKTIIAEWTIAITKAIARYENEDAEVKLFSKILKHRINEDFRYVLYRVKDKIKSFLKAYIISNSPYMRESQVSTYLKEKMQGKLEEKEWASIVISIYSDEEYTYIVNLIKEHITSKTYSQTKSSKLTDEITFADFQNIILSYDLTTHETLLSPFAEMFKNHDIDEDGLINQDEFRKMCEILGVYERVEELISKVDPCSLGKIGFSSCVKVFSDEKVPGNKEKFSVIHSLFFSQHDNLENY